MTCARAYRRLIDSGVPAEHITMTSDGNAGGRQPNGENVLGAIGVCIREIRSMVREEGFSLTDALKLMTVNPARIYRLEQKGQLKEGKDADLLFLDHGDCPGQSAVARQRAGCPRCPGRSFAG